MDVMFCTDYQTAEKNHVLTKLSQDSIHYVSYEQENYLTAGPIKVPHIYKLISSGNIHLHALS